MRALGASWAVLAVCAAAGPPTAGQTIAVRDDHPRLVFTSDGAGGTRTFQTVRDLYAYNGHNNPFYQEVRSWATGSYGSSDPVQEASRFVVTGSLARAESALNSMVSGSLSYSGEGAEAGIRWALAYDWIHDAWSGSPSPPADLAGKLATAEGKLAGWVSSALDALDAGSLSLWHGRASVGAAAWVAALALPAGNATYDSYRQRAWSHWQQSLKATGASGGWPEGPTYWATNRAINFPLAQMSYVSAVTAAPALAVADPVADLRTMGLWQAYTERGDGSFNRYGDVSSQVQISNGTIGRSLDLYAQVTGDPALAAFAQHARQYRWPLYHSEYGWMYAVGYDPYQAKPPGYDPAQPGECLADALPDAVVFGPDALGLAVIRQGWSPGDTQISFKAGDYLAHHGHYDQGTFTLFKHAPLVIDSGGYGPYVGDHRLNYYVRTVGVNSILVQRPDERWTPPGTAPPGGYVNDGGQRIVKATGSSVRSYEYWLANKTSGKNYESGDLTAFDSIDGRYTYLAADLTRAYNSTLYDSEGQGGKVSLVTRQLVYLAGADVLVIFDRVESTDPDYRKKWLLHTPNKFAGGTEVVLRGSGTDGIVEVDGATIPGRTMTMTNGPGRLFLQTLLPAEYLVHKVGGPNHRYYVEDDGDDADGYDGSNHDDYAETPWHDYGDWRIEISPKAPATFDTFLNVLTPRDAATASVAPASLLPASPGATVMQVAGWVVAFGSAGAVDDELTYALPAGGNLEHLVVDLPPGQFCRIDAAGEALGLFADDAGVVSFASDAAGPHEVALTCLPTPQAGDASLDGRVDYIDLGILATRYGGAGTWLDGDFTGEGNVDYVDLGILASYYQGGGRAAGVPEPGALALLLLAAAVAAKRLAATRRGARPMPTRGEL